MLLLFWFLLVLFGCALVLFLPTLWGREIHHQYSCLLYTSDAADE